MVARVMAHVNHRRVHDVNNPNNVYKKILKFVHKL